jgi:hypothetical protein
MTKEEYVQRVFDARLRMCKEVMDITNDYVCEHASEMPEVTTDGLYLEYDKKNPTDDIISSDKGFYRSLQFMPRGDNSFLSPSPIPRLTAPVQPIRKETANMIESFFFRGDELLAETLKRVPPKELEEFRRLASKCESQIADSGFPAEIIEMLTNEVLEYIQSDEFAAKNSLSLHIKRHKRCKPHPNQK